jgi:hypothetical protein
MMLLLLAKAALHLHLYPTLVRTLEQTLAQHPIKTYKIAHNAINTASSSTDSSSVPMLATILCRATHYTDIPPPLVLNAIDKLHTDKHVAEAFTHNHTLQTLAAIRLSRKQYQHFKHIPIFDNNPAQALQDIEILFPNVDHNFEELYMEPYKLVKVALEKHLHQDTQADQSAVEEIYKAFFKLRSAFPNVSHTFIFIAANSCNSSALKYYASSMQIST